MINIQHTADKAIISGILTRETITRVFEKKSKEIVNHKEITLDLANVIQVDTAGLAWLLMLIELASNKACKISLINLPEDLVKLAKLSAVDNFLSIKNDH